MSLSSSNISLSPSTSKINVLASKYKRYCNQVNQEPSQLSELLKKTLEGCQCLWVKVMPVSIRGWTSDFEEFSHYWKNEIGKSCSRQQVSPYTVQQSLSRFQGNKMVLALLYSPMTFRMVTTFVNSLPVELTSKVIFCPLNIESSTFSKFFEDKVGYQNQSILVLWKGLFDEIIVLDKFRTSERLIWESVNNVIQSRVSYQSQIKKKACQCMSNS